MDPWGPRVNVVSLLAIFACHCVSAYRLHELLDLPRDVLSQLVSHISEKWVFVPPPLNNGGIIFLKHSHPDSITISSDFPQNYICAYRVICLANCPEPTPCFSPKASIMFCLSTHGPSLTHSNSFRGKFVFLWSGALTCMWRRHSPPFVGGGGTHLQCIYYSVLYTDHQSLITHFKGCMGHSPVFEGGTHLHLRGWGHSLPVYLLFGTIYWSRQLKVTLLLLQSGMEGYKIDTLTPFFY